LGDLQSINYWHPTYFNWSYIYKNENGQCITGRYRSLASVPRKLCDHHDNFVIAAQAGPLARALALGVTVFAYPEKFVTKRKIQHAITSAKTRATAMLRQQTHTAKR